MAGFGSDAFGVKVATNEYSYLTSQDLIDIYVVKSLAILTF